MVKKKNLYAIAFLVACLLFSISGRKGPFHVKDDIPGKKEITLGGITFVHIPGGEYLMGGRYYPEESPPHKVWVDQFWMSKYEITQKQYRDITGTNPVKKNSVGGYGDNYPVFEVSWHDAVSFCEKFREKHSIRKRVRLPYEAEWE
jgi:formylglycine-generating enzyme required for sulfatase activity